MEENSKPVLKFYCREDKEGKIYFNMQEIKSKEKERGNKFTDDKKRLYRSLEKKNSTKENFFSIENEILKKKAKEVTVARGGVTKFAEKDVAEKIFHSLSHYEFRNSGVIFSPEELRRCESPDNVPRPLKKPKGEEKGKKRKVKSFLLTSKWEKREYNSSPFEPPQIGFEEMPLEVVPNLLCERMLLCCQQGKISFRCNSPEAKIPPLMEISFSIIASGVGSFQELVEDYSNFEILSQDYSFKQKGKLKWENLVVELKQTFPSEGTYFLFLFSPDNQVGVKFQVGQEPAKENQMQYSPLQQELDYDENSTRGSKRQFDEFSFDQLFMETTELGEGAQFFWDISEQYNALKDSLSSLSLEEKSPEKSTKASPSLSPPKSEETAQAESERPLEAKERDSFEFSNHSSCTPLEKEEIEELKALEIQRLLIVSKELREKAVENKVFDENAKKIYASCEFKGKSMSTKQMLSLWGLNTRLLMGFSSKRPKCPNGEEHFVQPFLKFDYKGFTFFCRCTVCRNESNKNLMLSDQNFYSFCHKWFKPTKLILALLSNLSNQNSLVASMEKMTIDNSSTTPLTTYPTSLPKEGSVEPNATLEQSISTVEMK